MHALASSQTLSQPPEQLVRGLLIVGHGALSPKSWHTVAQVEDMAVSSRSRSLCRRVRLVCLLVLSTGAAGCLAGPHPLPPATDHGAADASLPTSLGGHDFDGGGVVTPAPSDAGVALDGDSGKVSDAACAPTASQRSVNDSDAGCVSDDASALSLP
jgi:hypothetical protein